MAGPKKILISHSIGEVRAAVCIGDIITDIRLYRDHVPSYVGTVFLGRVSKLSKELQAAYVELGDNLAGFLPLKTLPKPAGKKPRDLTTLLHEGQRLIVQVVTDARNEKQLKLSARIELVTPTVIFHPHRAGAYVSSRIRDPERREELKKYGHSLDLQDYGLTFRTDAQHVPNDDLTDVARTLILHWQEATKNIKSCPCPAVISQPSDPLEQILREFVSADTDEILIDDSALLGRAKKWLQTYFTKKVECAIHYSNKEALFNRYLVEDELDSILSDRLYLKSGAWITIEQTEALTAIDVNMGSARFSNDREKQIFTLNREAMREIFRQLRLRSIGGIIVIDFVDMTDKGDIKSLQNFADELMANDPAPMQRGNISSFGLMEVTRSSRGASLDELLISKVQKRKNISAVCLALLRREEQEAARRPGIARTIKIDDEQKKWFDLKPDLLEQFTNKTGSILKLEVE